MCAELTPVVYRLRDEYKGRVEILRINPHGKRATALEDTLRATFTPTFVFVGVDGGVRNMLVGEVEEADLRRELDGLLATQ